MRTIALWFLSALLFVGVHCEPETPDEEVPADGDAGFASKLQEVTAKSRQALSIDLKQDIVNVLYDAAREGNGTAEAMEISPDDIHLPQNAGDTAQLFGIPELAHDYLKSVGVTPFVRRSAKVAHPRDKYDYTYKLMASWMPPNAPETRAPKSLTPKDAAKNTATLVQDSVSALTPS